MSDVARTQSPFKSGLGVWNKVYTTPWYSMALRDTWFRLETTSGLNPAVVLPVDSMDRVLLVEVYRAALDRVVLETPRGFLEEGETGREGALRELVEETGLAIASKDLIDLGVIYPDSGIMNTEVPLFAVKLDVPFTDLEIDPGELLGHRLVPILQVEKMLDAGLICDSYMMMAVKRYLSGALTAKTSGPGDVHGIEMSVDVLDENAKTVVTLQTRRPDWSFTQYCRNRETPGWSWRFTPK